MLRIRLVGEIFGISGYSSHCRQLFNSLIKNKNLDIKLDVPLPLDWVRFVNDDELNSIKKLDRLDDITIGVTTPPYSRIISNNTKKYIQYVIWEGNKIPKYWIEYLFDSRVDQIWVASQHTKDAINNTFKDWLNDILKIDNWEVTNAEIMNKIKIVPHGINPEVFKPKDIKRDNTFNFICNKGWKSNWDRGGTQYLIKAYLEEFINEDDVNLIVKINPAYGIPNIDILMKDLLPQNKLKEKFPKIQFNIDNIPFDKLINFYNLGDVYCCTTRAEAFDLGSAEALACGLPIITTNYGGQIEHMNKDCALFVDYKLEEVKEDVMYEGISWATPDIEDIKKKMRWCYENQGECKTMGKKGWEFINQNFTWDMSAKKAFDFLTEIFIKEGLEKIKEEEKMLEKAKEMYGGIQFKKMDEEFEPKELVL